MAQKLLYVKYKGVGPGGMQGTGRGMWEPAAVRGMREPGCLCGNVIIHMLKDFAVIETPIV